MLPLHVLVADDEPVSRTVVGAMLKKAGYPVLFAQDGALIYSGGATGSRGHAGDNAGRQTILALLNHERTDRDRASVFGCPLFAREPDVPITESTANGPDTRR